MKQTTFVIVTLSLLLTQCSPQSTTSTVQQDQAESADFDDQEVSALSLHLALGVSGYAVASNPSVKGRLVGATVGLLAAHQVLNMIIMRQEGMGLHDYSLHAIDVSNGSRVELARADLIRHLRRYQEFFTHLDADEIVDSQGEINDTFLKDLITSAGYDRMRPQVKKEFVEQIILVMKLDETPTPHDLRVMGITDPVALEINLAMNGIRRGFSMDKSDPERIKAFQRAFETSEAMYGVNLILLGSVGMRNFATKDAILAGGATVIMALGSGIVAKHLDDKVIWGLMESDGETVRPMNNADLAMILQAVSFYLQDKTIDDLIDQEGRVVDEFAQDFLSQWAGEEKLSPAQEKKILEQLLIVIKADPEDSHLALRERGVIDSRFIAVFDTWHEIKGI